MWSFLHFEAYADPLVDIFAKADKCMATRFLVLAYFVPSFVCTDDLDPCNVLNKKGIENYTCPGVLAAQRKINCLSTGAEIEAPKTLRRETPKASSGWGKERGHPPPQPTRSLGSVMSSASGVPGRKRFILLLGVT